MGREQAANTCIHDALYEHHPGAAGKRAVGGARRVHGGMAGSSHGDGQLARVRMIRFFLKSTFIQLSL